MLHDALDALTEGLVHLENASASSALNTMTWKHAPDSELRIHCLPRPINSATQDCRFDPKRFPASRCTPPSPSVPRSMSPRATRTKRPGTL